MKNLNKVPNSVLELIKLTLPAKARFINDELSLSSVMDLIEEWRIGYGKRLDAAVNDKFTPFKKQIMKALVELGFLDTIAPKYFEYHAIVILGSTGLSHYQIWQDLIQLIQSQSIKCDSIYLLGGDRKIHPNFDLLDIAYRFHPEHFKRLLSHAEIMLCKNEMELMELITATLKFPDEFKNIPKVSVYASGTTLSDGSFIQADTEDTIIKLHQKHPFPKDAKVLFISTLPYIIRQGLQAKLHLPEIDADIAAYSHPYLETIDTPLKGELPLSLYMDELYWFLFVKSQFG